MRRLCYVALLGLIWAGACAPGRRDRSADWGYPGLGVVSLLRGLLGRIGRYLPNRGVGEPHRRALVDFPEGALVGQPPEPLTARAAFSICSSHALPCSAPAHAQATIPGPQVRAAQADEGRSPARDRGDTGRHPHHLAAPQSTSRRREGSIRNQRVPGAMPGRRSAPPDRPLCYRTCYPIPQYVAGQDGMRAGP